MTDTDVERIYGAPFLRSPSSPQLTCSNRRRIGVRKSPILLHRERILLHRENGSVLFTLKWIYKKKGFGLDGGPYTPVPHQVLRKGLNSLLRGGS